MPFRSLVLLTALGGLFFSGDLEAYACGEGVSCSVGQRSYEVALPDGWNGEDPLPVLVHFHGWGRTGTNVVRNHKIAGAARKNGVLLLAPNGLGRSWSFWQSGARDVPFVEAMLDDAAKHWPIDRSKLYVSGFSYGGAMAWRLACERGEDFAAFLPIGGTLWNFDELRQCASPVNMRHVHGLRDTVMDLPLGEGGDPLFSVSPWLNRNGCMEKPDSVSEAGNMTRYAWAECESGKDVVLDLHTGGHIIPDNWLDQQLRALQNGSKAS